MSSNQLLIEEIVSLSDRRKAERALRLRSVKSYEYAGSQYVGREVFINSLARKLR